MGGFVDGFNLSFWSVCQRSTISRPGQVVFISRFKAGERGATAIEVEFRAGESQMFSASQVVNCSLRRDNTRRA